MTNPIIKATAMSIAAATLLATATTPAYAEQSTTMPNNGQNQTNTTPRERLTQAVKDAQAKNSQDRDWDETSKTEFDEALQAATNVTDETTDENVTSIALRLETAIANLKSTAEKTLENAITAAKNVDGADYTTDSYTPVKTALDDAEKLAASDDKAGDMLRSEKADTLNQALNCLELQAHADLDRLVDEATATRDNGRVWTDTSKTMLDDTLTQARTLLDSTDADKTSLTTMMENVSDALDALESQAHADLKTALERYKTLDRSRFTDDERESLTEAYGGAKTADRLADNADNDMIRGQAANELNTVIDMLKYPAVDQLNQAISRANAKLAQERDWDDTSKTLMGEALATASGTFPDTKDGDKARVQAAERLEQATASLTTIQKTTLAETIKEAQQVNQARLTEQSRTMLATAIENAQAELTDDKTGDEQAETLTSNIKTAMADMKSLTMSVLETACDAYDTTIRSEREWSDTTRATKAFVAARKTLLLADTEDNDIARQKAADLLNSELDGLSTVQQDAYRASVETARERVTDTKYTQETRLNLQNVLDADGSLTASDREGDLRLADASARIDTAVAATIRVSRDRLNQTISRTNAKLAQERDWDDTSKTLVDEALTAAVNAGDDMSDDELDALSDTLSAALAKLTTVQRTGFESAVKNANAMCLETKYTADWCQRLMSTVSQVKADVSAVADDRDGDDAYARASNIIGEFMASPEYVTDQSLSDALRSAEAFQTRGLDYPSDLEDAHNAFMDAYAKAKAGVHKDVDTQKALVAGLNNAQNTLLGMSVQERKYAKSFNAASGLDCDDYTADSYAVLSGLLTGFDPTVADAETLERQAKAVDDAVDALMVVSWSVDGAVLVETDGVWSGHIILDGAPSGMVAVGADGRTVSLDAGDESFTQGGSVLGVGVSSGSLSGSGSHVRFDVSYEYRNGVETSVKDSVADGARFTLRDGVWSASFTGVLGTSDDPSAYSVEEIVLSDGSVLKRSGLSDVQSAPIHVDGRPDKTQLRRTVVFSGVDSHGSEVCVSGELSGVYDGSVGLSLTYTTADGTSVPVSVDGMPSTVDTLPDSITLPAQERALAGMKWNVTAQKGGSVSDVSSSATVKEDGTRVFLVTVRYFRHESDGSFSKAVKRVRVTVPFQSASKVSGNEKAILKGFTVNGRMLDGFSSDVVDYTIRAGADERVVVSPVAQDGQDVRAGDSRQTAYTTTQYWTVSKDGESRTYSVTLVRDHDTPTADESFTPASTHGLVSKDANPSMDNTLLKSVGYSLDGVYYPADGLTVTVPEGGVFAYESYEGQTVDVVSSRLGGMTWSYSLGVLAADGVAYAVCDVRVTYVTASTHKAVLSGIKVDGVSVSGFDASLLEYTVKVANVDRYVVTPVFDKSCGMGVTVHKDGSLVTLTATSADGLVQTVYTVHVEADPLLSVLSATGAGVLVLAMVAGVLGLLGVGVAWLSRRRDM